MEHEKNCAFKFATQKFLAPPVDTTKRGPYQKSPLFSSNIRESTRKERIRSAHDMLKEWANNRKEDLGDTLAYLLKREWTETKDDRLGPYLQMLESEN